SVARCTSSAVSPGATSSSTSPHPVTRMYAISVTIVPTTRTPVSGSVHFFKIFGAPSFVVCSIATTTRRAPATKSIAPPIPFTIFPGIIQFARLPDSSTSIAPSTLKSMCAPRVDTAQSPASHSPTATPLPSPPEHDSQSASASQCQGSHKIHRATPAQSDSQSARASQCPYRACSSSCHPERLCHPDLPCHPERGLCFAPAKHNRSRRILTAQHRRHPPRSIAMNPLSFRVGICHSERSEEPAFASTILEPALLQRPPTNP